MKKVTSGNDLIVDLIFGFVTIGAVTFMVAGLLFLTIVPINNYHHAKGTVELKRQYKVVAQQEGSITRVFTDNYVAVERDAPLVQFQSESNERVINELNVRLQYLQKEYTTFETLYRSGAINRPTMEIKGLEIQETETKLRDYKRNIIYAPVSGKIYYKALPENMHGGFIEKGEVIGYIYSSDEKHIRITFPNTFADRFKIGARVLFKYSDPVSFKVKKMKGFLYKTFINKSDNTIDLYCNLDGGAEQLAIFQPFTEIDAAITINSTSVCNDMFGIDPFPSVKNFLYRFEWCRDLIKLIKGES